MKINARKKRRSKVELEKATKTSEGKYQLVQQPPLLVTLE